MTTTICFRATAFGLLLGSLGVGPAAAQTLDTRLIASGLSSPVFATAPVNDGRTFIVEKGGAIKVAQGGVVSNFFTVPVASSGEQGLLGLAFDPNYGVAGTPGHRRFFVNYIDPTTRDTVIASHRVNEAGTGVVAGSRVEVMRFDQPDALSNHKAGWIAFKPGDSNHLYIATGDGGGGNDPLNSGQDLGVPLGKMLRIDINADSFPGDPNRNYGIPSDNPFAAVAGAQAEIFAYGLRNPWRNGFDRANGNLWIADVGQGSREEVNFISASSAGGQNFGWRVREGDIATPGVGGELEVGMVNPVLTYDRNAGVSITGGYVVRDVNSPLFGQYVFGDFVYGNIWAISGDGSAQSFGNALDLTAELDAGAAGPLGNIASFGEGFNGELLIVDYGGKVVQVVPEPGTAAMLVMGASVLLAAVGRRRRGSMLESAPEGLARVSG